MILIADSGSSKTDWIVCNHQTGEIIDSEITEGINPVIMSDQQIAQTLQNDSPIAGSQFNNIYFYGAGCSTISNRNRLTNILSQHFISKEISVESDMLGAARSLLGKKHGIAAIIGTGSNSCYYNGDVIVKQVSPLGYILGDEGSGAVIGKIFLASLLKNRLPPELKELFFDTYKITPEQIIENVYSKPSPNRYMASYIPFIKLHIDTPYIYKIVYDQFLEFFQRNISHYTEASQLPVNFTGSVAFNFREIIIAAGSAAGFQTGLFSKSPATGLIFFHINR